MAYNATDLRHADIQEDALSAFKKECITRDEYEAIKTAYPSPLYTPNPFIRIGLLLLTLVITVFTLGLIALIMFSNSRASETTTGVVCIMYGLACYGALEFFIREKHHYRSGVDDGLAWSSAALILGGCTLLWELDPDSVTFCLIVFGLGAFFAARFLNMAMGLAAFGALMGALFFALSWNGPAVLPFIYMAVCAAIYSGARKFARDPYHGPTLQLIQIASLLMGYLAGNYFVVRETGRELHGHDFGMTAGWLFWLLTIVIPLGYIYAGLRKKDKILLRTGLLLIAFIVFTIRYYHSVMPLETAMALGGTMMILLAWALIRYLKTPRHGFTNEELNEAETLKGLQIAESLVIAQTFKEVPQQPDQLEFGGGSTRGGGAGGDF